jgi:voltage-gated sodium channel
MVPLPTAVPSPREETSTSKPNGRSIARFNSAAEESEDVDSEASGSNGVRNTERRPSGLQQQRTIRQSTAAGGVRHAFANVEDMKREVRIALANGMYDVKDMYKETGWAQQIARSASFEAITLFVISANAIWIAIDTDLNSAATLVDADAIFQVVENLFCVFFLFEWGARACAFEDRRNCLKDAWFMFDGMLVFMMIFETWVLPLILISTGNSGSSGTGGTGGGAVLKLIRLVRLTRMGRMARLLRAVPELVILIKGIAVAARSVFFTLVLLVVIIYFFAIVLRQLTDGSEIGQEYYPSIFKSMSSLLLDYILPDQSTSIKAHGDDNIGLGFLTLVYMLLAGLTVMNMLVGVLVEVVGVVSSVEKEGLTVSYVKTRLDTLFTSLADEDGSRRISKMEFQRLLVKPEAAKIIQEIGVDVYGLVDISEFVFQDDHELDFVEFMELVLALRGSNTATVKDIVDLRKFLSTEMRHLEERLASSTPTDPKRLANGAAPPCANVASVLGIAPKVWRGISKFEDGQDAGRSASQQLVGFKTKIVR